MAPPAVIYEPEPPWAWVRLNRPEVHNAFDVTLRDGLFEALGAAAADPAVQAVAILGEGPSFGTGGDLREFSMTPEPWRNKLIRRERDVWTRLLRHRCFTVALLHGHVAGSGLELALACDLRLATAESRWLLPETGTGMIPGAGGTQLLPRLARPGRALAMMLLGQPLSGSEAHRCGLAQALIGPAAAGPAPLREAGREWLERQARPRLRSAADGGPLLPRLKALLCGGLEMPLQEALQWEQAASLG
jgi:enoyl-CoA hydratase/carnithine racemase